MQSAPEDLAAEALRVNARYLEEVVLAFGLCPWAERSIRDGRVRREVAAAPIPALAEALAFVDALERAPATEIGLLIFPRIALAANEFDRFAETVRQADRRRRPLAELPAFVLQAFHPAPGPEVDTPYQMVSFIRRTPDPTIQFVRYQILAAARSSAPALSDSIAERNFATVNADRQRVEAILDDIRADRDRAYARLGVG